MEDQQLDELIRRIGRNQDELEFAAAIAHLERKKAIYGDNHYLISDEEFAKVDKGPKSEAEIFLEQLEHIKKKLYSGPKRSGKVGRTFATLILGSALVLIGFVICDPGLWRWVWAIIGSILLLMSIANLFSRIKRSNNH